MELTNLSDFLFLINAKMIASKSIIFQIIFNSYREDAYKL